MIKYLTHNMIDKTRWDDCIAKSFNGNVYVWSWYLDTVHPQWEALVENDYENVMPLTGNKKYGINYLFQPFFVQQLGVFSQKALSPEIIENFLKAIPQKYLFAEIRLNVYNKIKDNPNYVKTHRNVELNLTSDYQDIYNHYNSNTKRNLAKAKASDLILTKNISPETIITLFKNNRGKEIKHWKNKEYNRLLDLIRTAIYHEKCFLYGVNNSDNQTVAGAVFMYSHHRIIFLFSGADKSNKENHGLTLLIDRVIRDFSESNNIFDFEGSDNDGLARFYKGFGGKEVYYPGIKYNHLNGFAKLLTKILGK